MLNCHISNGFIPKTFGDDNDPLDVLVLCQEEILPMTLVECIPIGILNMIDENERDEKIIAVPVNDPSMCCYKDISELPLHTFQEIQHFFTVYKSLENKDTVVKEVMGREDAIKIITHCIEEYNHCYCGKR